MLAIKILDLNLSVILKWVPKLSDFEDVEIEIKHERKFKWVFFEVNWSWINERVENGFWFGVKKEEKKNGLICSQVKCHLFLSVGEKINLRGGESRKVKDNFR